MAKERKSPQEKKKQEYSKDHFTFSEHSSFPKTWKKKKTYANREFRRKSQELLVQARPGMAADDVAEVGDNLTVGLFQRSVVRKPLRKWGTVTVGEKVKVKLERRAERVDHRVKSHKAQDLAAASAIRTLSSLEGENLANFARRSAILLSRNESKRELGQSKDALDKALYFVLCTVGGRCSERDALRRNQELCRAWQAWIAKANRVLARDRRVIERKNKDKKATGEKVNMLRRATRRSATAV